MPVNGQYLMEVHVYACMYTRELVCKCKHVFGYMYACVQM